MRAGIAVMCLAFIVVLYNAVHEVLIEPEDPAPAFSITADQGKRISVPPFEGNALLLNFWATWCLPCQDEIPSLKDLATKLGPRGLVIFAVSSDDDSAAYNAFLNRAALNFPTIRQPGKDLQSNYGTISIPESFLIDRRGKVRAKFISSQNWTSPEILAQIDALL